MAGLEGYQSNIGQLAQPTSVSAPATQMGAQQMQSLSQKLSSFSATMHRMDEANTRVQAADNAVADMGKYKREVNNILGDNTISDSERQDKLQKLAADHEYDGWGGAYKQAYKTSFDSAYANSVTNEAAGVADYFESISKGSSASFLNDWSKYSDGIVRSAPTDALAATTRLTLDKKGSSKFKTLATAEYKKQYDLKKKSSEDVLENLETEYITAYSNYDQAGMNSSLIQYDSALKSAVNNGFITQDQADIRKKVAIEEANIATFKVDFNNVLSSGGNAGNMIESIFKSPIFAKLPVKKQDELMKSMFSELNSKDTRIRQAKSDLEAEEKDMQDENYKSYLVGIYNGSMNLDRINSAESKGFINKADATSLRATFSEGSIKHSDQKTIAWYSLSKNLVDATEEDIYSDSRLSWSDRAKMVGARKELLTSKEYKWTTSQNGKEARARIKRHFGFIEGTVMSKMDMNNENGKAYNKMMMDVFDEISSLPESDQALKSRDIAMRHIAEYESGKEEKKEKTKAYNLKQKEDKAKAAYDKYQNSWSSSWDDLTSTKITEEEFTKQWLLKNK